MVIAMLFYYYDYLLIQNFVNVSKIDSYKIEIKMRKYTFIISGECLKITYFSKEELKIEGNISQININYE